MQRFAGNRATAALLLSRPGGNHDPREREADRFAEGVPRRRTEGDRRQRTASAAGRLPEIERRFFEERLGRDLSDVKLHHDEGAAQRADVLSGRHAPSR